MRWQDYIEVEDGPDAEAIRKALDEIASTPEGQEYIERAVENLKESLGDPDAHGWLDPSKIDIKGTRGWDWNDTFGSSAMVPMSNNISNLSVFDQFKDLSEEQANTLEPELNALWQFKENEGMFERQLENLLSETSPNELDPMLETFHETYDSQWSQTLENKNTIQPEIVPETGPVPLPQ